MKKQILIPVLIIIVIVVLVLIYSFQGTKQVNGEDIKIGAILALTGDAARWGESEKNGIELAKEEINSHGGINSRLIDIVYEDYQLDEDKAISAFYSLIEVKNIKFLLGPTWTDAAIVLAPLVDKKKIVTITPSASILPEEKEYIFSTWPSDTIAAKLLANQIYDDGHREIAVLTIQNLWAENLEKTVINNYTSLGGEVNYNGHFPVGTKDLRTEILKIRDSQAEAIYLISNVPETVQYLKQAKELDFSLPIYGSDAIEDPELIKLVGDLADGIKYLMPVEGGNEKFIKNYRDKYGEEPAISSDEAYDAMMVLAMTMKECDNLESICIKNNILTIKNYNGASGRFSFNEQGFIEKEFFLKIIREGEFVAF